MAGSDFLDSLISCYKIMNPPLRKTIISTTYLCLIGLTEDPKPRLTTLIDQLYSLDAAAKAHKEGPTNVNDSLVAEERGRGDISFARGFHPSTSQNKRSFRRALHFGRRNPTITADDVLEDKSQAPNKAAILAALATFDSDDDERDDSYDVEDVGGTVDSAIPGNDPQESIIDVKDGQDEVLFRAYKTNQGVFARDSATRRGAPRTRLKEETGMTDESIEGWALMLSRDPRQMRRLESKFSSFGGEQRELKASSWKAAPGGSGTEDSDVDVNARGRGGRLLRGGRGGGRGRGRGNVAGPTGERETEAARRGKEANKGSRANHNRRDQRAKKMARGGFPG
ncbi:putative CUE domain-containing protein 3 [Glarea lozoyensis 74030]|uniref:Putative CUE domain-containing protein 3 n=1 Tax=Glarea lozoyensis (strain ATCC 74030 / MF5533) TaxID=1104152 RepID=H0EL94_GLAL7|nr:putative CUE domain-containing protein 3 [Glarea lozoyensis 74030]